ncbi:hypothetical protein EYF80_055087 [Liparis tanakae]|uniref:Uncharacterized protein n=1 Tax=Liparis tanakae TaxID=230148 RepID=A0A4Z2F2M9_9TELE|nr:hypothetical protein EYF80_055087 [Liparis tanakae]
MDDVQLSVFWSSPLKDAVTAGAMRWFTGTKAFTLGRLLRTPCHGKLLGDSTPEDSVSRQIPEDSVSRQTPEDSVSRQTPEDSVSRQTPEDSVSR